MTSVRPTQHPLVQPRTPAADPARLAAQRAFFDLAAGKAAGAPPATPASAQAVAAASPAPVRRTPDAAPAEAPARPLRPGSLLDIRV